MKQTMKKAVSIFLTLLMTMSLMNTVGLINVSAAVEGENVYMWPLYMEAGITGKGNTFDCYFGKAAQGKAIYASGTMEINVNFPSAGTYNYELILHNQWGGAKNLNVWLDDNQAGANTHSTPASPSEDPVTGSLTVSTPGIHTVRLSGGAAIVRLNIIGAAPAPLALASPAANAVNVVTNNLTFDWTQNSTDVNYYAIPNGANQFKVMVSENSNFSSAYEKTVTLEDLGITDNSDQSQMRSRAQTTWTAADGTLEPGTTYYWKVVAENGNGTTESEVRSFTTLSGTDSVAPTPGNSGTITTTGVTEYTAQLDWTNATDNISSSEAIKYFIYRSETAIGSLSDAKTGTLLNEGGSTNITSYLDGTRTPEMSYYYAVIAADEAGNEAMYQPIQADAPVAKAEMRLWGAFVVDNIDQLHKSAGENNEDIGFARVHSGLTEIEINLPAAGTYAYNARVMGTWANGIGVTIHEKSDETGENAIFFPFDGRNGAFHECKGFITVPEAGTYTLVLNGGRDINARERIGIDWISVYGATPSPFTLTGPENGAAEVSSGNLVFDWTQTAMPDSRPYWPNGADSYTITIDTQEDFNSGHAIRKDVPRGGSSGGYAGSAQYKWVPATDGMLAPGTTYYWKVTANNGNGGTDSNVFSFTTLDGFGVTSMQINGNEITGDTRLSSGDNTVTIQLENSDGIMEGSATLIVALYNSATRSVETVNVKSHELTAGSNSITSDIISVPQDGSYTLKAFLWKDIDNMEPITNTLFEVRQ